MRTIRGMLVTLALASSAWAWPPQPSTWKFTPTAVTVNTCGLPTGGLMVPWGARIGTTAALDGICYWYPPGPNVLPCYPFTPLLRDFHGQAAWELWSSWSLIWGAILTQGYHDRYFPSNDYVEYWELYSSGTQCRVRITGQWKRP